MAWDSSRPIPWRRLIRDWVIYAVIMTAILAFLRRDDLQIGPFLGIAVSGPLFIVIGATLAKFGYQRKTMKDIRAETADRQQAKAATARSVTATDRSRPAPTKRTSTGASQRPKAKPRRR